MNCPKCGGDMSTGGHFCPHCGARIVPVPVEPAFRVSGIAVDGGSVVNIGRPDATHSLEPCPICGAYNPREKTFRCKHCGRESICLRHQQLVAPFWCDECAKVPDARHSPSQSSTAGTPRVEHRTAPNRSAPTSTDFQRELDCIFQEATQNGNTVIEVRAGDLHRRTGGYPGPNNRMPSCCGVLRRNMRATDQVVYAPPKGNGANLMIRYKLPR